MNKILQMGAVKIVTGDFAKNPLAEVLHLLHADKETATLVCRNGERKRALFLWRGQVSGAESSVAGERLIDVLLTMSRVTPEQHQRIQEQEGGNKSAAQLLVELGMMPVRDVVSFIRVHIVGVLRSLFEESEGIFKLMLGEVPERGFSVRLPVPELIVQGTKHIGSIEKLLGYLGRIDRRAVVQPGRKVDSAWRLGAADEQLANALKNRPTYQSLLEKPGVSRHEVAALLYVLEVLGYLTPADSRKAAVDTDLRRARAEARKAEEREDDIRALPQPTDLAPQLPKPSSVSPDVLEVSAAAPVPATAAVPEDAPDLSPFEKLDSMTHYQLLSLEPSAFPALVAARAAARRGA